MVKNKVTDEGGGETVPFSGSNVPDEAYRRYYKEALKAQQEVERIQEVLKAARSLFFHITTHTLRRRKGKAGRVFTDARCHFLSSSQIRPNLANVYGT